MEKNDLRLPNAYNDENSRIVPLKVQEQDEATIWIKFKQGDEAAFIWIYTQYFAKLYSYAKQFDLDSELIKDQIQDLFIYIRKNRDRLAEVNSIKYYLFKSLRRKLISNATKRFQMVSLFAFENRKIFEIGITESHEHNLIFQGLNEEIKSRLSKSINKITIRQREAVQYFFYHGMSYREIADIMELKNVKYARKLIYRAIEALREDLQEWRT